MAVRLNWLIYGAGAIGTYIGVSLILHGQKVVFIEQPAAASEILEHGLRLNIRGQEHRILHPEMTSDIPLALRKASFDIAVFALKSYDTHAFLDAMLPYVHLLPPVLCLQNGVENEAAIETIMGKGNVIAGTVTSSVRRRGPGDVLLERLRGVGVASGHPLSTTITQGLSESGLNAQLISSASAMKWSKMLTNLLANASSAILDMTPEEILHHPRLYAMEITQLREAILVMRAHHINLANLPGTQVKPFAWLVDNLPPWLSRFLLSRIASQGRGHKMPSFHIDLYSGSQRSEVDYLNGAVVRFGAMLNIPTPVNVWLNQTLQSLTQGKLPLEIYSHQPDKYLLALNSYIESEKTNFHSIVP